MVSHSKHRNKKKKWKILCFNFKKTYQIKNTLSKWILQNISQNQKVQRTAKFIMAGFYEMDTMKGIVRLVKVDDMHKILKSPLANRFWSRDRTG